MLQFRTGHTPCSQFALPRYIRSLLHSLRRDGRIGLRDSVLADLVERSAARVVAARTARHVRIVKETGKNLGVD